MTSSERQPPPAGTVGHPRLESGTVPRRHGHNVIRRRPHQARVIHCPPTVERSPFATPIVHARRFALALILIILIGTLLLLTPWATEPGQSTSPYDAMFTAVSAACVTGLVTVNTSTHWTFFGELTILALIQAGGLGFMVGASLVLAILRRGSSLRDAMLMQDGSPTLTLREALDYSGQIVRFTAFVESAGALILTLYFWLDTGLSFREALWNGIFHSVGAFCNAGFDLSANFQSLVPYDQSVVVNVVIATLIQAGAISYIVLHDVWRSRSWGRLALDSKLVLTINAVLVLGAAAVFLVMEWNHALAETPSWARPMSAVFQSIAARTAGFTTVNFGQAATVTLLVWLGVMAIGGASGSTAGGIKMSTIGVVVVAVVSALHGNTDTQIFGRRLPAPFIFRAMAVIVLYMTIYFFITMALIISDGSRLEDRFSTAGLLFESMSALATVGLTTGLTPELSNAGKVILAIGMFLGRIGPLSFAYALQGRQRPPRYRYPEEPVRIG